MSQASVVGDAAVAAAAHRYWGGDDPRPERLLVLRAQPRWDGPPTMTAAGGPVRVVPCPSTLAVRAALADGAEGERLVVLTDVPEADLGIGLLAHAVRQRVLVVDVWDAVREAFGVRRVEGVDGSLVRVGEPFAQALVASTPRERWAPPPSGTLTRDHVMEQVVVRLAGMPLDRLDLAGLLGWSLEPTGVPAYRDLVPALREPVRAWLLDRLGTSARPVLDLADRGHGTEAVALGLVAGLLWGPDGDVRAQGRLDATYLERELAPGEVQEWSEASRGWVERALSSDPDRAARVLGTADDVLAELGADGTARASDLLPSGFAARLEALGVALERAAARPGPDGVRVAERALASVQDHRLAPVREDRVAVASMAVRLLRWSASPDPSPRTALEALEWQVRVGGWVDRARQRVWNGDAHPVLAQGLRRTFEAVSVASRDLDRAAAALVAEAVSTDQRPGRLVPVEEALERLVLPLAAERPVLLLVLDGMSAAVACELAEHLAASGWSELVPREDGRRAALMAGLPTVTEVSRTSLLSGRLQRGGQREERAGLRDVAGPRAALFHLGDLAGGAGVDLPQDVRDAVLDVERPVVAAVLNAVDDALGGGDPARTVWTVDAVRHLRPLLERAAVAGRVVVLVSDHGHVVDQPDAGEVRRASGGGARWRPASEPPAVDEVLLEGRRVLLGDGRVVAAVDETLRYTPRAEGYHGGAALAELAIPVLVVVRRGTEPPAGWGVAAAQQPEWWDEPAPERDDVATQLAARPDAAATLFSEAADGETADPGQPLVDVLEATGLLDEVAGSLGRDVVERLVAALGGGSRVSLDVLAGDSSVDDVRAALTRLARAVDPDRVDDVVRLDDTSVQVDVDAAVRALTA